MHNEVTRGPIEDYSSRVGCLLILVEDTAAAGSWAYNGHVEKCRTAVHVGSKAYMIGDNGRSTA